MPQKFELNLLGGFAVYRDMEPLMLPPSCRRVVALAALKRRTLHRSWMCDTLWPDSAPAKAVASLRSALWRLRPLGAEPLLVVDRRHVTLAPHVRVDWHEALHQIEQLNATSAGADPALKRLLRGGELLDGWNESWCSPERNRYRALRAIATATVDDRQVAHYAQRDDGSSAP